MSYESEQDKDASIFPESGCTCLQASRLCRLVPAKRQKLGSVEDEG